MRVPRPAGAVLALLLTACAPQGPALQADWANGAKRAWVLNTVDPSRMHEVLPSCVQALPPEELATLHFVKVRFWHGRRPFTEVAEVPADLSLQAGDEVELLPEACGEGRPARIARVLAAKGA